jgi:hypothetical protein
MGRKDGETIAPTVIGTPKPNVTAPAITTASTGTSPPRSSTTPNIAPPAVNANTQPVIERISHTAKVGRERGNESPAPVSPARAALAGRNAPSRKLCIPIRFVAIPTVTPKIEYWTSREALAPAITPTTIKSSKAHTGINHNPRTSAARVRA